MIKSSIGKEAKRTQTPPVQIYYKMCTTILKTKLTIFTASPRNVLFHEST